MDFTFPGILLLLAGWLFYFAFHSITASLTMKCWMAGRWPGLMPLYRLIFNGLALLLLLPLLWFLYTLPGPMLWQWTGVGWWLANGLALLALLLFGWSLSYYDGAEFLGLRQWRSGERSVEDQEHLRISSLHRYVRHPWYSLGLVLIWTRDMDLPFLATAVAATLYFIVGSRMEERKLLVYHGKSYRRYRERVPGLLPLPWRHLSSEEARRIEEGQAGPGGSVSVDDRE